MAFLAPHAWAVDGFAVLVRHDSPDLFMETARLIPGARLLLYPGLGHVGTVAHRPVIDQIGQFLCRPV